MLSNKYSTKFKNLFTTKKGAVQCTFVFILIRIRVSDVLKKVVDSELKKFPLVPLEACKV